MSNIGEEIAKITKQSGKAANSMTSGLKSLGNGSMENGLKTIADYSEKVGFANGMRDGYKQGQKSGTLKGSAMTVVAISVILGCSYWYQKHKVKQVDNKLEEENMQNKEKILDAFENSELTNTNDVVNKD